MNQATQEGAGGHHHGSNREFPAVGQPQTGDPAIGQQEFVRLALDYGQIGGFSDRGLHRGRIKLAVDLGAGTTNRRTLPAVQNPELDATLVGHPAHQAIQSIDFPDQMALSKASDGGIAGHRTDGRELVGHQRGFRAHARGCRRGFTAGVPAPDHNHIKCRLHARLLSLWCES